MTDPRLHSLHLEGLPRRDLFRAARDRLHNACGNSTLAGDAGLLADDESAGGATVSGPPAGGTYWLHDGHTLHPLRTGVNSVGRLPDNTVVIRDEHVSRRHCAVVVHRDGRCEVHDVASKNGTVLNGAKIAGPTRLRPGDQLTLCTTRLVLLTGSAPAPPPAEPGGNG